METSPPGATVATEGRPNGHTALEEQNARVKNALFKDILYKHYSNF